LYNPGGLTNRNPLSVSLFRLSMTFSNVCEGFS
jgi:hypothetical protein